MPVQQHLARCTTNMPPSPTVLIDDGDLDVELARRRYLLGMETKLQAQDGTCPSPGEVDDPLYYHPSRIQAYKAMVSAAPTQTLQTALRPEVVAVPGKSRGQHYLASSLQNPTSVELGNAVIDPDFWGQVCMLPATAESEKYHLRCADADEGKGLLHFQLQFAQHSPTTQEHAPELARVKRQAELSRELHLLESKGLVRKRHASLQHLVERQRQELLGDEARCADKLERARLREFCKMREEAERFRRMRELPRAYHFLFTRPGPGGTTTRPSDALRMRQMRDSVQWAKAALLPPGARACVCMCVSE